MTSAVYPVFKEYQITGSGQNLLTATVKLILLNSSVAVYDWHHTMLSQVVSSGFYKTSGALTGKTITPIATGARFDCSDVTFTAVSGAGPINGFLGFVDTGDPTTSPLIFYQSDTMSGSPITPDGGNIMLTVDAGGLFVL